MTAVITDLQKTTVKKKDNMSNILNINELKPY